MQLDDLVALRLKHLADLTIPSLMDRDFQERGLLVFILGEKLYLCRSGNVVFDLHPFFKSCDLFFFYQTIDDCLVGLLHFEGRMDQLLHEITVIA